MRSNAKVRAQAHPRTQPKNLATKPKNKVETLPKKCVPQQGRGVEGPQTFNSEHLHPHLKTLIYNDAGWRRLMCCVLCSAVCALQFFGYGTRQCR